MGPPGGARRAGHRTDRRPGRGAVRLPSPGGGGRRRYRLRQAGAVACADAGQPERARQPVPGRRGARGSAAADAMGGAGIRNVAQRVRATPRRWPCARRPRRSAPGQRHAVRGPPAALRLPGVQRRAALDRCHERRGLHGHGPGFAWAGRAVEPLRQRLRRAQRRCRRPARAALLPRAPRAGACQGRRAARRPAWRGPGPGRTCRGVAGTTTLPAGGAAQQPARGAGADADARPVGKRQDDADTRPARAERRDPLSRRCRTQAPVRPGCAGAQRRGAEGAAVFTRRHPRHADAIARAGANWRCRAATA